jgi:hypothetical protein
LIESAKKKNDASIEDAINSLKGRKMQNNGSQKMQTNENSNGNNTVIMQPSN